MDVQFLNIKKYSALLVSGLLLITASMSTQAEQRERYTCYIMLDDQSKVIHQFVAVDETKSELLERIPSSPVFAKDGVSKQGIVAIYECITGKEQFKNYQARQLLKTTPM